MLRLFIVVFSLLLLLPLCSDTRAEERQLSPEITASLQRGLGLLREGNIFEARQEFSHTLKLDPACYEAYNNIGLTYYRAGDLEKAAENYSKAYQLNPSYLPSVINLGTVRHQQKQLDKAKNLYTLALDQLGAKDPEIHYDLANVLRDLKDYKEAQNEYRKALEMNPDLYAAHNGLGATYYCLERFDDAEKEIRKALKLKPDYALAYYHLGLIETKQKRYDEAIQAYKDSLKYEENKGYAKDTENKIAYVKKLINDATKETSPTLPPAAVTNKPGPPLLTAQSRIDKNDFRRAASELEIKLAVNPKDPVLWNNFGLALRYQDDARLLDRAVNAYKKALDRSDDSQYQSCYNLAQLLKAKGDYDGADKECLKAIKIAQAQNHVCPEVHNLRAIIMKSAGKFDKANEEYLAAIHQSAGKFPVFHYNRALLLEKMNKRKEAKKEYSTYLEQAPDGLNAQRARMRLGFLSM